MLKVKDWLKSKRTNIQFTYNFKKFAETGIKTAIRINDGVEFFEGQVIKMMSLNVNIIKFHNDRINVDITLNTLDSSVPHTVEINLLYHK